MTFLGHANRFRGISSIYRSEKKISARRKVKLKLNKKAFSVKSMTCKLVRSFEF